MDTERRERLSELVKAALGLAPAERAALLDREVADDDELRREVESLLTYEGATEDFIETSAMKLAARQLAIAQAEAQAELAAGTYIRQYRIVKPIGAGGMGKVYLAEDTRLQRPVAIKFLAENFAAGTDRARRFEREALTISALRHPNIVTIHEHFNHDGLYLLVTEFVEGETLRQILASVALDWREAIRIAAQIAAALNTAHSAGIIHRDIKPENVIRQPDGHIKVLDFGIAKYLDQAEPAETQSSSTVNREKHTQTGQFFYTPGYASPEQARGERELDARADIFSLGVMMFEMLSRQRPFAAAMDDAKIAVLLDEHEVPDVRERSLDIPAALSAIVAKALRKQREHRYQSANELLGELQELRNLAEAPNSEKATTRFATRNANRLLTQFTVSYLDEPGTRIPLIKMWAIWRSANLRRGRLENELLRKSLRTGLLKLGMWTSGVAIIAVIFAAWMSVTDHWDERTLRDGHTAGVRRAAFSPNGARLVSADESGMVLVWDFHRRELIKSLAGHKGRINSIVFAPNGKHFATAGLDQTAIVWDAATLAQTAVLREQQASITGVTFSPDGKYLATASDEPDARTLLWETKRWERVRDLPLPGGDWAELLFAPNNPRWLFTRGQRCDVETGQIVEGEGYEIGSGTSFSPDGSQLVNVTSNGTVVFVNLRQQQTSKHSVHRDCGRAVAFSPDGKFVATGAEDIILWNVATQELILRWEHSSYVWGLAWSPDGRYLVSTYGDGSILLWDVIARERTANLNQHSLPVNAVAFSPDGRHIASGSEDRSVFIWNAASGRKEAVLLGHQQRVNAVAFSPSGNKLVSLGQNGELISWDVEQRQPRWRAKEGYSYGRLAFSPDGRWLAAAWGIHDSDTGQLVFLYEGHLPIPGAADDIAFSADGQRLATVVAGGLLQLRVWETGRWQVIGHEYANEDITVSISPNGQQLVTGGVKGTLTLWQAIPLQRLGVLGGHQARIKQVVFSHDGRQVVSAGDDDKIKLWDADSRKLLKEIGTHTAPVLAAAFSPDGQQIVSGEQDKSVRIYTRHHSLWGWPLN